MSASNPLTDTARIRRIRTGRILVEGGRLIAIERRWLPAQVSMLRVWWDTHFPNGRPDRCVLDFHQPWGSPGFLTLDYVRSGPGTSFKSFRRAVATLDEVARIQSSLAIVAHVSTQSISDRLLARWGWEQHCLQWKGRHWIKRFYDGHPA